MKNIGRIMKYLLIIFILMGCSSHKNICPTYPKPSQYVLLKIKSLNNLLVNEWLKKQYKLNKKLKECNE